jgi:tetratricopeptide (TPR) repeat protein
LLGALSLFFLFTLAQADELKPEEQQCRARLQALGQALKLHLIYNDGKLPGRISELYKQGFVLDLDTFCCPASGTRITDPARIDEQSDYLVTTNATDEKPLLLFKERSAFHNGKTLAFYSDRSIRDYAPGATVANRPPSPPPLVTNAIPAITAPPSVVAPPAPRTNAVPAAVATVSAKPPVADTAPVSPLQQNEARTAYFSGMMAMSGKRPAEAEKYFRQAVEKDPHTVNYRLQLGHVLYQQEKWAEAAEAYRGAVQLEPDTGSHHGNLAAALMRDGKRDEAVAEAKEVMRCGIKEHWIYRELGLTP